MSTPGNTVEHPILDKAIGKAEGVLVDGLFVPPALHRWRNAFGLTAGMAMGLYLRNLLAGQTWDGMKTKKEDVIFPLRPLHGLMDHNPFADDAHNRWMHVACNMIPAAFGAAGVLTSSRWHFNDRLAAVEKTLSSTERVKVTLVEAEKAMGMVQSRSWAWLTAFSSLFGSRSGMNWFYGATLGKTFELRSGRKAFTHEFFSWMEKKTGLKMFTNFSRTMAHSSNGPELMVKEISDYLAGNDTSAISPQVRRRLEEYGQGIVNYFVREAKPETLRGIADELIKQRGAGTDVGKHMCNWFTGGGFEKYLVDHEHFNPKNVESILKTFNIGANGYTGGLGSLVSRKTRDMETKIRKTWAEGLGDRVEKLGKAHP